MVCDHFCFGEGKCGWDCKEGGETVADCMGGQSYFGGGSCDDNCMANGLTPDGKECAYGMTCDHYCFGDSCGWYCNVDGETVADCMGGESYFHDQPCHDHCMANGLTSDGTECDYGMVCEYFCWGSSCGWDCKEDGKPVADCMGGKSYTPSAGSCDDNCMANGLAPGTPFEYDGKACGADSTVPDPDAAGSKPSDPDTAGSKPSDSDTAGSKASDTDTAGTE